MSRWVCVDGICIPSDENDYYELVDFADAVSEQDPIDIVCCAECIDNSINCDGEENWCLRFGYDVEPSDFCSYGERKESE